MMGLGYLGNGVSSSSSSNLSPLAPPFTVDRSNSKPISNPLVHLTEAQYPPPPVPFSSPVNNWQYPHHSSSTRLDFFSNRDSGVDSIRTTSLASATDFCYEGSESIINPTMSNPWSLQNPSRETATDSLSYVGEPKPYYSSYVSPVIDDDTPPSYDLLSTSGFLPMDDGSSQVDYTQSLSGLEYAPQWGGLWNGLSSEGKRMEVDGGGFRSDDINVSGSLAYKNYTKQGGACELDSTISQEKYVDVFGRENRSGSLSIGQLQQDKSFVAQNRMSIPVESSKTPILRSGSMLSSESLMEPATISWNHQKPYNSPYEKQFKLFDSCMNDCAPLTKSFPAALSIRPPPAVGTTPISEPPHTVSSRAVDTGSSTIEDIASSSSKTKEGMSNKLVPKNAASSGGHHTTIKARSAFHVSSDINVTDGFSLTVESSEAAAKSTANSSESLDSPCWKGAPAAADISSLDAFEDMNLQQHFFTNQLEASSHGLNRIGGFHIFPPYNDSLKEASTSRELFENSSQNDNTCLRNNNGLSLPPEVTWDANLPTEEHNKSDDHAPKNSSSKGVPSIINNIMKPRNKYDVAPNESKCDSDSKPVETKKQQDVEVDSFTSQGIILKSGRESVSCVTSAAAGEEAATHQKTNGRRESTPKLDVHMLVNAMRNLSELLLFHCSHDDGCGALDKQDNEALKHVTANLDACMSKNKIVHMSPTQEQTTFPQIQGTSPQLVEVLSDPPHMGDSAGRHREINETGELCGELGRQFIAAERKRNDVSGKKIEKSSAAHFTLRDDADVVSKDHNIIQGIKKVLDEDFQCSEELESEASLFKNLWLEAEAELCIANYRTRFDRVMKKTEMEKCSKLGREKEEKLSSSSKVSPYPNITVLEGASTCKVSSPDPNVTRTLLTPKASPEANITCALTSKEEEEANNSLLVPQKTSINSAAAAAYSVRSNNSDHHHDEFDKDNVEASVMARFKILKCRPGSNTSNTMINTEGEQQLPDDWPAAVIGGENKSFEVAVGPPRFKNRSSAAGGKKGDDVADEFRYDDESDESEKEFHVCVTDDPVVVQPPYYSGNNNNNNKRPPPHTTHLLTAWYDYNNSSLDWEHVLKDDFALDTVCHHQFDPNKKN